MTTLVGLRSDVGAKLYDTLKGRRLALGSEVDGVAQRRFTLVLLSCENNISKATADEMRS